MSAYIHTSSYFHCCFTCKALESRVAFQHFLLHVCYQPANTELHSGFIAFPLSGALSLPAYGDPSSGLAPLINPAQPHLPDWLPQSNRALIGSAVFFIREELDGALTPGSFPLDKCPHLLPAVHTNKQEAVALIKLTCLQAALTDLW